MIGARAASVVSDGIVLALTVAKTRTLNKARRAQCEDDPTPTLSGILFRDTVSCFSLLCAINVIGMATGRLTEFIEIWQIWTATFTSVLLSRLSLDLREVSDSGQSDFLSRTLPSYGPGSSDASTQFTEVEALEMYAPTSTPSP